MYNIIQRITESLNTRNFITFDNIPKHHGIHILLQQLIADAEVFSLHIGKTTLFQIAAHGITEHARRPRRKR